MRHQIDEEPQVAGVSAVRRAIHIGLPVPLFKSPFELRTPPVRSFDMLPDGRFIMVGRVDDGADRPEICVLSSSTPA